MRVELRRERWYLCDWADQPDGEYREFRGSQDLALQWLRQFRPDYSAMNALRKLCTQQSMISLSDDEVLGRVSAWLSSGRVKARRPVILIAKETGPSEQKPVKESPVFPLESRERSSGPAAVPRPAEAPLFPNDVDPEAIAASQRTAALLGVPFCEECVRR
jgi:hypothetical protein